MRRLGLVLLCMMIITGCGLIGEPIPEIDRSPPFTAKADVRVGQHHYNATIAYTADGSLTLEAAPGPLWRPLRQVADDGGCRVELGQRQMSYPADWVGSAVMAQLIRQALRAPEAARILRSGSPAVEGSANGAPFIIQGDDQENILRRLLFPTLDTEIVLSSFRRTAE
jgi:hypothetical protein